jgi:hypothetical protein
MEFHSLRPWHNSCEIISKFNYRKEVKIMSIQPINSINSSDPIQSPIRTDFQNFRKSFGALEDAMKSGNQDQVTLSENALQQAMTQFQTDLSSLQQVNATNPSQSQSQNSMNADYQNLLTALNSVQDATKSGNQDQITKAQNTLQQAMNQFQTDVSSVQQGQGHHHHHHHHPSNAANSSSTTNNLLSYLAAALGDGSRGQSQSTPSGVGLNITT